MSEPAMWTDFRGLQWREIQSMRRLKFKNPSHAALRAHVFHRDGYKCARCHAKAAFVPANYSGRYTLNTDTLVAGKFADILVIDHVLTMSAGGVNSLGNFQTLCETCNKRKQKEDKAATSTLRGAP